MRTMVVVCMPEAAWVPTSWYGWQNPVQAEMHLDLMQTMSDDSTPSHACPCQVVGVRYYTGVVNMREMVVLVREPQNPYDAVRSVTQPFEKTM